MTSAASKPAKSTINGGESVFVEQVTGGARLVTMADDAPLLASLPAINLV